MKMMNRFLLLAILAALPALAMATNNNPPNECGNHGNNCNTGGGTTTANGGDAYAGAAAGAVAGAAAGAVSGSSSSVGDIRNTANGGTGGAVLASGNSHNDNTNVANGGKGGEGGAGFGFGGDAKQGQDQQQGQAQSSKNTNVNGQAQSANSNQTQSSYSGANQSQDASNKGVTTIVGGDTTLVERNAPPVFLGAITPTSCGGSFNAGGSSRDGAGGIGFSWVGTECAIRQLGDRYQQMGQVDTACELYRSTKAFQKAAKRNPKLASLDCSVKPAPAAAIVPTPQASAYAPRIPRG